jgi:sugar/nucleoside kinase (ribokinase family)
MLSDPGSLAQFGPDSLDVNDRTLIEAADLVLIANWSQNRLGTPLVEAIGHHSRRANTLTMLDTGDPSSRLAEVHELTSRIIPCEDLDIYALNENELRLISGKRLRAGDEEVAQARAFAAMRPHGALDLHTARLAATFGPRGEAIAPTFRVEPLRVTGAGDAWNAGDIVGHLGGLEAADRLLFANAVAGMYVSGKEALAPTLTEVIGFLEEAPRLHSA